MSSGEFVNFGSGTMEGEAQMHQLAVAGNQEIVDSREAFFVPVALDKDPIFCVDDRPSDQDKYIHWLGGILDPVYSVLVQQEMARPGSVRGSLTGNIHSMMPVIVRAARIEFPGVHSDDASEGGAQELNLSIMDGAVGCGYAFNRKVIGEQNFQDAESLIEAAKQKRPELFESSSDDHYAHALIAAHERLTHRKGFLGSGRELVLAAMREGALSMVVRGSQHNAQDAIYNLDPATTMQTTAAAEASQDAYIKDAGLIAKAYEGIRKVYPYDMRALMIGDLIDTISTFRLLGIEDDNIAVRLPA